MAAMELSVNSTLYTIEVDPDTPLLWVIRDTLGFTGTKYSCGKGLCGACTVHIDGEPVRSCTLPISSVVGNEITTIEGLTNNNTHPIQQAWSSENVPQCGYCQPGQIMTAVALLKRNPNPTDEEINAAMSGNLCRCGTYQRIRSAIQRSAGG